ncbi:UvrD-helicase domain-containing protein [Bradyrhizobium sp. RDM12]
MDERRLAPPRERSGSLCTASPDQNSRPPRKAVSRPRGHSSRGVLTTSVTHYCTGGTRRFVAIECRSLPSQSFKAGGALSSSVELPNSLPEPSVPTTATNLGELNPGQRRGKTDTLAHRVAYLIANGADPGRRLPMTFSQQAAAEMADQVPRLVGELGKESLALERSARGNLPRLSFARMCRADIVRASDCLAMYSRSVNRAGPGRVLPCCASRTSELKQLLAP